MQRFFRILVVLNCFVLLGLTAGPVHTQENPEVKVKLALLPCLLPGDAADYVHVLVASLYDVLDEIETFAPVFSYYSGDSRYDPSPIPPEQLSKEEKEQIWIKKSYFSPYQPNPDLVYRIGNRLGVDAVLLYSVQIAGTGSDRLYAYLFDIKEKRELAKRISDEIKHNYTNEISETILASRIKEITRNVLDRF